MTTQAQAAASIAESLAHDPTDGADALCWSALARVVDDDPVFVFSEGDSNGCTITCMVIDGPFVGATVPAMLACPVGAPTFSPVSKGQRVLLQFTSGRLDGHVLITHTVPGGKENPLPGVVAGVAIDQAMAPEKENPGDAAPAVLLAPPPRIGSREYYRGALKVIRLKGMQDDYNSGWLVSADDGASVERRWNSVDQSYVTEIKGKDGERLSVGSGFVSLFSANGDNYVQVSDDQVTIRGKFVNVLADSTLSLDGGFVCAGMNGLPPNPLNACAVGVAGPANVPSARVFIGIV